jgi:hypothetical protein
VSEGSAENIFPEPALPDAHLGILLSTLSRNTSHAILTWGANPTGNPPDDPPRYDTDLNKLLPDLVELPTYSTSMQQVQWEEDTGGATADLTVAAVTVVRGVDATRSWRWVIAAPHTADHLQMPTVPDDVDDFMPAEGDTIRIPEFINAKVTLTTPAAAGYDAVRAHILEVEEPIILNPNDFQPLGNRVGFVTGAQGEVVLVGLPSLDRLRARGLASGLRASWRTASAKALRASPKAAKAKPAPASTKSVKPANVRRASSMLSPGHLPQAAR